jgi:NAD(P)-dependent dehydrogenase (short-subunit alcohol dehydrogenase family)
VRDLNGKKVAIYGGTGSIGSAIAIGLVVSGAKVTVLCRGNAKRNIRDLERAKVSIIDNVDVMTDVGMYQMPPDLGDFDVVIYAVGECPPHGFDEATDTELIDYKPESLIDEVELYCNGLLRVFQGCFDGEGAQLKPGGDFLVVGSAIARLKKNDRVPDEIHLWPHAGVMALQRALVYGMWHEPVVRKNKIRIHSIRPGAVQTVFHEGSKKPKPPSALEISDVVGQVLYALEGEEEANWQLPPD